MALEAPSRPATLRDGAASSESLAEALPVFENRPQVCNSLEIEPVLSRFLARDDPASNGLYLLMSKLLLARGGARPRCLGSVSATSGEGKTTLLTGLAAAFARGADSRVLLVDADMRRPSIASKLGLDRSPGLADYLSGEGEGILQLRKLEPLGIYFLDAGTDSAGSVELLRSWRMDHLMLSIRRTFDVALFDCPPLLPVADSLYLQELVDGFLFVVRARFAPRALIMRALSNLRQERILGTLLNDERKLPGAYDTHGYKYYGSQT